jgi:hypothetical protein
MPCEEACRLSLARGTYAVEPGESLGVTARKARRLV